MASEQAGARKKQGRNIPREEHHHPILYRHQDCIPNPKLLKTCDKQNVLFLKNNQDLQGQGKLTNEQVTGDLKNRAKHFNSKVKESEKSDTPLGGAKLNPQKSNGTVANNEELSKSRRRRLRKRRLLVSLVPPSSNSKPVLPIDSNLQSKTVLHPVIQPSTVVLTTPTQSSSKTSDSAKPSPKDSRKRLDKSVGSRSKNIKSKTLAETTNQSKADLRKTLEEKTFTSLLQTLSPLTNSSPKKEKPLSLFSFPEKRLNSSDTKVDKDGVFYFGETKHQLEKLTSGFGKLNTSLVQDKTEFAQITEINKNCFSASKQSNVNVDFPTFDSSIEFSPISKSIVNTLADIKQHLFGTEAISLANKIENKRSFTLGPFDNQTKEQKLNTPVLKDLAQFPSPSFHFNKAPACAPPTITNTLGTCENNTINISDSFRTSPEKSQPFYDPTIVTSEKELNSSHRVLLDDTKINPETTISQILMKSTEEMNKSSKTREEIKQEREAKKNAKLAAKSKHKTSQISKTEVPNIEGKLEIPASVRNQNDNKIENKEIIPNNETQNSCKEFKINKENIISDDKVYVSLPTKETESCVKTTEQPNSVQEPGAKSKAELRAERRAKQEAQRAVKAASKDSKPQPKEKSILKLKDEQQSKTDVNPGLIDKKPEVIKTSQPKPKLFSHLYKEKATLTSNQKLKLGSLHPAIVRLGVQYSERVVVGSNARCVALLHALKQMVNDYTTPSEKEFSRGLEEELGPVTLYLNQCRPLAVSMTNALRHIKRTLTQLPNSIPDIEARRKICDVVDTYIHEQIDVAGKAICNTVKKKIANGDVILTYGCSSLVYKILVESHLSGTKFKVVVVDGLPWREGREMLRRLVDKGLSCTYVLITAASFIMREASKVLLGAHALLANGYVMSRAGSSQVALLAHCHNVPVLVCCETHKFCERVQTDAFVYNELGTLCSDNIREKSLMLPSLTPLSLAYDITPPDLVSAVVTELAVLPCTSVPVILRIKPSESVM